MEWAEFGQEMGRIGGRPIGQIWNQLIFIWAEFGQKNWTN